MPDRAWEELVAEGRQLDKKEGELRFAWGDWALKVAPMGRRGAHNDSTTALQQAMVDAGVASVSFGMLLKARTVAHAWPPARRRLGAAWSVHESLAAHEDRFDLIRPGMTVDEARRLLGRPAHRPSDADGKAAVIREQLRDPEVAAKALAPRRPTARSYGFRSASSSRILASFLAPDL
jgi:hypothetical protein